MRQLHPPARIVGYARASVNDRDGTAQRKSPAGLGAPMGMTSGGHGVPGRNKERPGLNEALAAVRTGGTLVLTKLHRLAPPHPMLENIIEVMATS